MTQQRKYQMPADEVRKLNFILPKGYKFVTPEEFKKKAMIKPKKKTLLGLPVTQQIVTEMSNRNINSQSYQAPQSVYVPPTTPVVGRSTKNTKFMGIPSYESLPQSYLEIPVGKSYEKIPISLDYYSEKKQLLSTPVVFSKLKNHPQIMELDKVKPEQYSLSFRQIERKVNMEKDNYKVQELIQDVSKLCLKIYESYPRDSNEYQNTVSIQKYLKSLTKVQKQEPSYYSQAPTVGLTRQPSTISQIKKKPPIRMNELNTAITIKQKRQLGQRIKKLPSQYLQQICFIIFQNLQNKDYPFDLDTLHIKKIRQLQEYVNACSDHAQFIKENQDQSRINEDDEGEESSFIIQGDGQEDQANPYESQF